MFARVGWGLIFPFCLLAEPLNVEIKGTAAVMINAETGAILFEHNAYTQYYPASTTKVATALYALKLKGDQLDLPITAEQDSIAWVTEEARHQSNYTLAAHWLETNASHIGIKKGEILSLGDLLKGMLIPSGNDAANVIAQALAPSIPVFMKQLNDYLQELGCKNTYFCNPHGLHDPKHLTTAYDLAIITQEALKNPIFRDIVSQKRFLRPKTNKQAAAALLQTNRLLRPGKLFYSKAIGVKTGNHSKAKKTFIGAAESDGRTLIVVLLGYQDRNEMFQDAVMLFETAFNQPKVKRLFLKAGPQTFTWDIPKAASVLKTELQEELSLDYYPAEDPKAKCLLYWHPVPLPIVKGQTVGELQLADAQGKVLKSAPLIASEDVLLAWPYRWKTFLPWIAGGLISLFIAIRILRRRA